MFTRRTFVRSSAGLAAVASLPQWLRAQPAAGATYLNPILGGDHPDGSPIRVGDDFYLTHSSFDFGPGLLIWHSRDLVNWKPVAAALHKYYGSVYAPYLCEYEGKFYIYFPANGRLQVTTAAHPTGPWSEPVDLGIGAIDPCHTAENGRRFLYMNGGLMAELSADGLSVKVPPKPAFAPWPVPSSIRMECTCLEAPKILKHGDYYYLTVAEGGTGGPSTSHMVVSARSRHADGPWEYSPHNPVVHTTDRHARWLSVGHGRLVDTPQGKWFMTVHGYENGYRTLGRQLLLLPVEWTDDGWFRVPENVTAESAIPMPIPGTKQEAFADPSDDFRAPELGLQWGFWHEYDTTRFKTGDGAMVLEARGKSLLDSPALTTPVGGHSYTIEIDVEIEPGSEAGLLLFYDPGHATGILIGPEGIGVRLANGYVPGRSAKASRATLRVVNDDQEVDFYYKLPGAEWTRCAESAEVAGMDHNVLGGFLDLRPAVYASGSGKATFRNFRYRAGAFKS
jgi:xylan 1,4-beta-xylosidase